VPGFGIGSNVDKVGLLATAAVGGAFAAHGLVSLARRWKDTRAEHEESRREEKGDES
jgi:hydrogenase small subunit